MLTMDNKREEEIKQEKEEGGEEEHERGNKKRRGMRRRRRITRRWHNSRTRGNMYTPSCLGYLALVCIYIEIDIGGKQKV